MFSLWKCIGRRSTPRRQPPGLKWRSSVWFITLVVALGVAVDVLVYNMIVPVIPFRLKTLGYRHIASKTSILLLTYSLGLVFSIPPVVWLSERLGGSRKSIIIFGQTFLVASQVMFMFAPNYGVMILSRILQGISGSVIWALGLALLCDTVPEHRVGQQIGLAMAGLSIGFAVGPALGGTLYQKLGFRAPFILGIALAIVDLIGRIVLIERRVALDWGVDPWGPSEPTASPNPSFFEMSVSGSGTHRSPTDISRDVSAMQRFPTDVTGDPNTPKGPSPISKPPRTLNSWGVLWALMRSTRAMVAVVNTFICGIIFTSQEPTLTLRLHDAWGLTSLKVGLVYIAAAVPTMIAGALSGWLTDKYGPKYIASICLGLAAPWLMLMVIRGPLALFIVSLAFFMFFLSGVISPMTSELAATSRGLDGVGYGHVFGAWMLAYSIGSSLGPVVGGPIYDHIHHGWLVLCIAQTILALIALTLSLLFTGEPPIQFAPGTTSSSRNLVV